jgi:multiple sugar transport system substrate-binding protein
VAARLKIFFLLGIFGGLAGCRALSPKTIVTFAVFGEPAELAAYESLAQAFEQAHPAIDIELRTTPGQSEYRQKLAAEFASGNPSQIVLLNYRRFAAFAAEGGLEPLGTYLQSSSLIQPEDFYPITLAAFEYEGQLWCIPQNLSSLVVYYNRTLFEAAGIAEPAVDWRWEDFLAAARALTRDLNGDGVIDQFGVGISPELLRLAPFLWQNGGELVDDPQHPTRLALDSEAARQTFEWFVALQTVEHVAPDALAEAAEPAENRFLNGRLGMYFNSRRGVPTYRAITAFDWDVAPLPRAAQAAGILHSDGYCLSAATENKAAAWQFIEFANSPAGQTRMAQTGRTVPSLIAVAESPAFLSPDLPPANSRIFIETIPFIRSVPVLPGWVRIEEAASVEIQRAFYGDAPVAAAIDAAIELTLPYFEAK